MKLILLILFVATFLFLYIYYGYYQDYKRNPKEFRRSIIGMPLGLIAALAGEREISDKLKNWANLSDEKEKQRKK